MGLLQSPWSMAIISPRILWTFLGGRRIWLGPLVRHCEMMSWSWSLCLPSHFLRSRSIFISALLKHFMSSLTIFRYQTVFLFLAGTFRWLSLRLVASCFLRLGCVPYFLWLLWAPLLMPRIWPHCWWPGTCSRWLGVLVVGWEVVGKTPKPLPHCRLVSSTSNIHSSVDVITSSLIWTVLVLTFGVPPFSKSAIKSARACDLIFFSFQTWYCVRWAPRPTSLVYWIYRDSVLCSLGVAKLLPQLSDLGSRPRVFLLETRLNMGFSRVGHLVFGCECFAYEVQQLLFYPGFLN